MAGTGKGVLPPSVFVVSAASADSNGSCVAAGPDDDALARTASSKARVDSDSLDVGVAGSRRLSPPSWAEVADGGAQASAVVASTPSSRSRGRSARVSVAALSDPVDDDCYLGRGKRLDDLDGAGRLVYRAIVGVALPFAAVLAIYGIMPVGFNRSMRMSLHPLRSTLLYVLAMQVLVVLSCRAVFATFGALLRTEADSADGVDTRILASLSVTHVSSLVVLFVLWAELRHLHRRVDHVEEFLKRHSHMIGELRLKWLTRALPWGAVLFALAVGPAMVAVWVVFILASNDRATHSLSHLFQVVFVANTLMGFAAACMVVRDLAAGLAARLKGELCRGHMTASRLEEFRLAWLSLRALTADLGCTPLTGLCMMGYLLVMITLSGYMAVVSFANGYVVLFVSISIMFAMSQAAILVICNAAHSLSDVMTYSFYEPLESRAWRGLPSDLLAEHQQFLHTISCNPAEVTFAGMVTIKRSTYLSMMAAITTYLIVLFQLRQSDEKPAPPLNSTAARLFVLGSGQGAS